MKKTNLTLLSIVLLAALALQNRLNAADYQPNYGSISEFGYKDFVPRFTAPEFDAAEWAQVMKDGGARLAGICLVHHDGFCLWDSEFTRWDSRDMGPRRAAMKHSTPAVLQALDPTTGEELWRYDKATPIAYIEWPDLFAIGDTVWLPDRKAMILIGLDAATGSEKTVHSIKKALDVGHHHRCYPNRASVNFAVLGRRGAEFVDLETGELTLHHCGCVPVAARGTCSGTVCSTVPPISEGPPSDLGAPAAGVGSRESHVVVGRLIPAIERDTDSAAVDGGLHVGSPVAVG